MTEHNPDLAAETDPGTAPGAFAVTVHGIGHYEPGEGAVKKLVSVLDEDQLSRIELIDFDWCSIVEVGRDSDEKVTQLSRSLLEAAHVAGQEQSGQLSLVVRGIGALFEALFKTSLLSGPAYLLLLISAVPVYTRFGSFGLAGAWVSFALDSIRILWGLTFGFFAFGVVLSALLAAIGLRMFAATLLRRLILIPLQPVIPIAYRLGTAETIGGLKNLAKWALLYGLLVGGIEACSADTAAQWSGLNLRNMFGLGGAFAAILVVAFWISRWISTPVKLARDIFNYIGDVGHRDRIQSGLERSLEQIPMGAHVILLGHSLGSVIALDSLCNSSTWSQCASVSLVTGGSPVFRFFQRFFPGLYFPRDASECVSLVRSRARARRWINAFRAGWLRGDPVGQQLFARGGSGTDVPIHQSGRILLKAHFDYWDDEDIASSVRKAWRETLPVSGTVSEPAGVTPVRHPELIGRFHRIGQGLMLVCALAGFAFAVTNSFAIVAQRRAAAEAFVGRAVAEGIKTRSKVTHWTTRWGYGQHLSFPVQVYQFEFADRDGVVRRPLFREVESSRFDGGLYFDSEAFRQYIGRGDDSDKKTFNVDVLYVMDDLHHLTLANPWLQARPSGFPVFEVLWVGLGPIFFFIVLLLAGTYYPCRFVAGAVLPPSETRASADVDLVAQLDSGTGF